MAIRFLGKEHTTPNRSTPAYCLSHKIQRYEILSLTLSQCHTGRGFNGTSYPFSWYKLSHHQLPLSSPVLLSSPTSYWIIHEAHIQWHLPHVTCTVSHKVPPSYSVLHFTYSHQSIISTHKIDTIHRNKKSVYLFMTYYRTCVCNMLTLDNLLPQ
jgi:hypothetical protein